MGREAEVERLTRALIKLPMAFIYGVPGVGKSALAYEFARQWSGPKVYTRVVDGVSLSEMIDDVRRQIADGPVQEVQCDEERSADLIDRMDARGTLWVIDDLHRFCDGSRRRLLTEIGQNLTKGRVLGTSRTLVTVAADAPDRLELRLVGLAHDEARTLWAALDEMYGPSSAFAEAFARSCGNPLLLRRAHSGSLDENDPFGAAIRELGPPELRAAAALALSEISLPVAILEQLLLPACARAALRKLTVGMIIDRPDRGACVVHDVFRDAILRSLTAQQIEEMHAELARLLLDGELDVVVRLREVCRHLVAIGRYDQVGQLLLDHGLALLRQGAASDLLRMYESIPVERRSVEVQTARARTMIRVLDLRGAFDELRRLVRSSSAPSQELELSLGQVANLTGDVDVAEQELLRVLADPSLTVARRVRALGSLAVTRVHQGRGLEARELIESIVGAIDDPLLVSHALLVRDFIIWVDEQQVSRDDYYERTQALLRQAPSSYRSRIVAPVLWVGTLAQEGRFAEAAEFLRRAEESIEQGELLMRVQLRGVYGSFLAERGDRLEALAELRSLSRALERSGYRAGRLWADAVIARLLFTLGQRQAARRLVDEIVERAGTAGITGVINLARRAQAHDPIVQVQQLDERAPHEEKRGYLARWHALWALRSAAAGDSVLARTHQAAVARLAVGPGYSLDRAIGHLADATLARLAGRSADNVAALEKAEREITAEAADPTLLHGLADAVGHVRVVTPTLRRIMVEPEVDFGDFDVVLDGREHRLRIEDCVVDLKTRPVLRRLLYILASHPGRIFTKEELTNQIWAGTYSPLVHDNALKVNIARLRKLLMRSPLEVEFKESGYALHAPERFLFIAVDSA